MPALWAASKIGKARPWILGTAFFVALPVFLIFNTPTSFSPTGRMIWVFVNYLLHVAVFGAVISVATATLLIKITSNSVERAKVTNLGGLLGQISNLIVVPTACRCLCILAAMKKATSV